MSAGVKGDRLRRAENTGLAGEAYNVVRDRILRGEISIGQVISRRKVAAELGMSFLPVSEALLRLEHDGLLESRPRAGTRVRVPSRADVEGHYVVREALESQAAMLFAARATREERAEVLKLAIRVDGLGTQPECNTQVYLALHEKLHRRIAECARCTALEEAILRTSAMAAAWLSATRAPSRGSSGSCHEAMARVLTRDDPATAAEAMRRHIQAGMDHALMRLEPWFQVQKAHAQTYSRTPKMRMAIDKLLERSAGAAR